jgi:predicted nucleic acid-binding Zn ribbon protein
VSGKRRSQPQGVGSLVRQVLDELGLERSHALLRVADCWDRVVGPEAARHSRPTALRGPALEATAASSAWCQELQLRRDEILAGLARELGDDAPSELWLRVG